MRALYLSSLLSVGLYSAAVLGSQGPAEQVVVTGSYSPIERSRLSSTMTVVDREEIKRLQKTSVLDVLRTVPGVLVNNEGGAGGQSSVSIRGGEANFTAVLIDGVQVNDPTNTRGGSFNFNNLNINSVERIEVVRGAQSAIYGSDALAGVIHIITVSATEESLNRVNAEAGQRGYYAFGYKHTGTAGNLGYAVNAQRLVSGEQVEGSERKGSEVTARLGGGLWEGGQLEASLRIADTDGTSYPEQSGGPDYALSNELDSNKSRDYSARVRVDHDVVSLWKTSVYVDGFYRTDKFASPGIVPYTNVPPRASDANYRLIKAGWLNTLRLSENLDLILGVDSRWEKGDSEGYFEFFGMQLPSDFKLDRQTTGFLGDLSWQHASGLVLQGSARYDRPDEISGERTYKAGIRWPVLDQKLVLFGNWGQGFKLPSFFSLGSPLVGNPDLKPEKATSTDLGVEWQALDELRITVVAFDNTYRDLIDFDSASFRGVNRSKVKTRGGELELDWRVIDSMGLRGHATYTDISSDEDVTLTGRPRWKAGLVYHWQFANDWLFNIDYQWNDDVFATTLYTGSTTVETLDGYHLFNANLQWQAAPWVVVKLSLDNVFNASYQEAVGFPGPGRLVRLGGEFSF